MAEIILDQLDYYKYLRPLNEPQERDRFLKAIEAGVVYNPRFRYAKLSSIKIGAIQRKLRQQGKASKADPILNSFSKVHLKVCDMLEAFIAQDLGKIEEFSGELFGSHKFLRQSAAEALLRRISKLIKKGKKIEAPAIAKFLATRCSELGFHNWKVQLAKSNVSEVEIYTKKRLITVHPQARFSSYGLQRLCAHELLAHAHQTTNGLNNQKYSELFGSYLGTELQLEGLAVFCEVATLPACAAYETLQRYLCFALATKYAATHSFDDTFKKVYALTGDRQVSLVAVVRAKKGFTDTSKGGCFHEGIYYLFGLHRVLGLVLKDRKNLNKLFAGGFPISAIDHITPVLAPKLSIKSKQARQIFKWLDKVIELRPSDTVA